LEVLAAAARQAVGIEEPVLLAPIQDARRGQVFAAVYQMQQDNIPPVIPATVCSLHSFFQQVKARQLSHVRFCAVELAPFLSEVQEADWGPEAVVIVTPCVAGVVAQIASAGLRKGRGLPASEVDANYVRASDAELFWKE
ncbi:MAG: hypothetical protein HY648_03790, partial [Acidobacteria bacterium]|nr:hypothetical protein [Acidobacteriota bacterium]